MNLARLGGYTMISSLSGLSASTWLPVDTSMHLPSTTHSVQNHHTIHHTTTLLSFSGLAASVRGTAKRQYTALHVLPWLRATF